MYGRASVPAPLYANALFFYKRTIRQEGRAETPARTFHSKARGETGKLFFYTPLVIRTTTDEMRHELTGPWLIDSIGQ